MGLDQSSLRMSWYFLSRQTAEAYSLNMDPWQHAARFSTLTLFPDHSSVSQEPSVAPAAAEVAVRAVAGEGEGA